MNRSTKFSLIIASAFCLGGATFGQRDAIYKSFFPIPSYRNGLEEYFMAGDLVDADPTLKSLTSWNGNQLLRLEAETGRKIAQKYAPILKLVSEGNLKPMTDFRKVPQTGNELHPELMNLQRTCRVLGYAAFGEASQGRTREAAHILAEALIFSRKMCVGPLSVSNLGVRNQAFLLSVISDLSYCLPLEGWVEIYDACKWVEAQGSRIASGMRSELTFTLNQFQNRGVPDGFSLDKVDPNDPKMKWLFDLTKELSEVKALEGFKKEAYLLKLKNRIYDYFNAYTRTLSGPEFKRSSPPVVKGITPIVQLVVPRHWEIGPPCVQEMTGLRLLQLTARVQMYRWNKGELPGKLSDLPEMPGEKPNIIDPLTGKEFIYRLLGADAYELYSEGTQENGRINLKYSLPNAPEARS